MLVRVEKVKMKKPFLGGYRHKETGVQYHNAAAQTLPIKRPAKGVELFQRETQTVKTRNKYQQVTVDAATQMDRTGCFISDQTDKIIVSGEREMAEDYHKRVLKNVLVLQTYWRRWLATKYVNALRQDRKARDQWEQEETVRKRKEKEAHMKREFDRRMNPKTKEDFDLLYHALEMWRQDELKEINRTTSGPERKAALCALLEQEADLIASIGRHKLVAAENNKEKEAKRFLDATAAPKSWIAFDGGVTEMDTPYTLRAKQLRDIYNSITMKGLLRDERLDVLLTLKCTVQEHDCKLTRDIVELVDREAELLIRGLDNNALEGG